MPFPKGNEMVRLEFKLAEYNFAVQRIKHSTMRIPFPEDMVYLFFLVDRRKSNFIYKISTTAIWGWGAVSKLVECLNLHSTFFKSKTFSLTRLPLAKELMPIYTIIIIIIIIMSCRLHRYPRPSLTTSPYRSSPPAGLHGYIPYPHIAAVCMFELVVLRLLGDMWGSIGVHHLWARLCFSSSVLRVCFI